MLFCCISKPQKYVVAKWTAGKTILHFFFEFSMTLVHMLSRDSFKLIVQSVHTHIIIDVRKKSEKF